VAVLTDILIRDVPDEDLHRIDAKAEQLGIHRTEYIRRQIAREARRLGPNDRPLTIEDFRKFSNLANGTFDPELAPTD